MTSRGLVLGFGLVWGFHPVLSGGFDEVEGADDVGLDEGLRAFDGVVDVAFGREVDDALDVVLGKEGFYEGFVADVAFDEGVVGECFGFFEVVKVSRIGEFVEVDEVVLGVFLGKVWHEVGADKAGATSD